MLSKKYLTMTNTIIRDVEYINDNSSTNYINSLLKKKSDFFLFKPESHFGNTINLLKSLRKRMNEDYFGTDKKPENPFRNCKTPNEIFNLSRNIKFDSKMKLARIGYVLMKNGEVSIVHKDESILQNNPNLQEINRDFIKKHETMLINSPTFNEDNKFSRYDYFMSAEMLEGIISANNYIQKGITVTALGDKKVYSNYGVFNPTRQDYLNLFDLYIKENIRDLKLNTKNICELGCGTGVLSLIMSQYGLPRIFAIDNSDNSIVATKSNSQAFGYFDNIKAVKLDLVETYSSIKAAKSKGNDRQETNSLVSLESKLKILTEKNIDHNFDLIVCNPPWINSSYVFSQTDLENAIYDPDHKFLRSAFNFAMSHLNRNNANARFCIIFSDLGSILNVNEPDIIEKLALENKLKITSIKSKQSEAKTRDNNDPLKNFKKESKVLIYELRRI
jgi:methylase of polypeptide subunit release factors